MGHTHQQLQIKAGHGQKKKVAFFCLLETGAIVPFLHCPYVWKEICFEPGSDWQLLVDPHAWIDITCRNS